MPGLLWQGLQGLPRTEVLSVLADFSSYKLLKTSVDSTPTHTRLQRTHNACSLSPPRSKHYSQEGVQVHSPGKSLFQTQISPGAQLYHAQPYTQQSHQLLHLYGQKECMRIPPASQETGVTWYLLPWLRHIFNNVESKKKIFWVHSDAEYLWYLLFSIQRWHLWWKRSDASLQTQLMMCTMHYEQFHLLRPRGEEQQDRKELFSTFGSQGCATAGHPNQKEMGSKIQDASISSKSTGSSLCVLTLCSQGGTSLPSVICRLNCTSLQFLLSGLVQVNLLIPK